MDDIIKFAKQFNGYPYGSWREGQIILGQCAPFYADNAPVPRPEEITKISCAGLINLIRRQLNLPIPGVVDKYPYAGGSYIWFQSLLPYLEPIDITQPYPIGTLLIRNYSNENDQGHLAILIDSRPTVLQSLLIHAIPPQVEINTVEHTHQWLPDGYYTHVVSPENWLT